MEKGCETSYTTTSPLGRRHRHCPS